MCSIFTLPAGINIDDDKIDKAVANNWHGYGIVMKDEGAKRLEVRRSFNETNGADPEEIARILKDNDDVTRYVHLRHTTKGANGLDNCHPFPVYSSMNREVYLFHNGTFNAKFHPKHGDDRSDSRIFAEEFVSDLLVRFEGDLGHGDYNYPLIKTIIEEFSGYNNRVLLVSNDLEPLYCANWNTIKNKDGSEFKASNNDYFDTIKRGPRYTVIPFRQSTHAVVPYGSNLKTTQNIGGAGSNTAPFPKVEKAKEEGKSLVEEAAEARRTNLINGRKVVSLKDAEDYSSKGPYCPPKALLESMGVTRDMFENFGFDAMCWVTDEELVQAFKEISPVVLVGLFRELVEAGTGLSQDIDLAEQLVNRLEQEVVDISEELCTSQEKHSKATKRIANLENALTSYERQDLNLKKVG